MAQQQTRVTGGDIVRDPQYEFSDDGTRFEGYSYKGSVPITRAAGTGSDECFISIRLDYIVSHNAPDFWKDLKYAEYFNGVDRSKYNRQVLNDICEYLYQKYIEKNPHPDTDNLPDVR